MQCSVFAAPCRPLTRPRSGKTIGLGGHSSAEVVMSDMEHLAEHSRAGTSGLAGGDEVLF